MAFGRFQKRVISWVVPVDLKNYSAVDAEGNEAISLCFKMFIFNEKRQPFRPLTEVCNAV